MPTPLAPTKPALVNPETAPFIVLFGDSLCAEPDHIWYGPECGEAATNPTYDECMLAVQDWYASDRFAEAGYNISYNAFGGTMVTSWLDRMASVPNDATAVVALGTNDISYHDSGYVKWQIMAALNELANAQCVVWLTLNITSAQLRGDEIYLKAVDVNNFLRNPATRSQWPNLKLKGWDILSQGHPEYLRSDKVHHTAAGQEAYVTTLISAPQRCIS